MKWLRRKRNEQNRIDGLASTSDVRSSLIADADAARDAHRWIEAAQLYTEYLDRSPERADVWIQLGHARKESGEVEAAKWAYEHAKTLMPKIPEVHLQLGHAQKLLGDFTGAARSYSEAVRLDPSFDAARKELYGDSLASSFLQAADGYRAVSHWRTAAQLYGTYLQLHPDRADIWIQLGHMRKEAGELSSAQQAYEEALQRKPDDLDAQIHLAHLFKTMGNIEACASAFIDVLKRDPSNGDACRELTALGRRQAALATVYERLPACKPTDRLAPVKPKSLAVFTIACSNYLAHVRVFVESAHRAYPDADIFLCLADRKQDTSLAYPEHCQVILVSELGIKDFDCFSFRYDIMEFNTAVKPTAFKFILDTLKYDQAIYFDPDIQVFARSNDVLQALEGGANFVLTPHLCAPASERGEPDDISIMRVGVYNLGFLAASRTPDTLNILEWWMRHLQYSCINRVDQGIFVDQKFIDLVPGLVDHVSIHRSPATNVAYWNLTERKLSMSDGVVTVNEVPLEFFHFSGFDFHQPDRLSKHTNLFINSGDPVLNRLMFDYGQILIKYGVETSKRIPYTYGTFKSGVRVTNVVRRYFAENHLTWQKDPYVVFEAELLARETCPDDGVVFTKLGQFIWEQQPYLRATYDRTPTGAAGLADWFQAHGARDLDLDPALARRIAERMRKGGTTDMTASDPEVSHAALPNVAIPLMGSSAEVTVIGYFRHASGVGEIGRRFVESLTKAGYRVETCDVSVAMELPLHLPGAAVSAIAPGAPIEVYCVNADEIVNVQRRLARQQSGVVRRILVPFWELERFPPEWLPNLAAVHQIWAPTRFIEKSLAAVTSTPVRYVPHRLDVDVAPARAGREHFGIPTSSFVVYTAFDFRSFVSRKNPEGTIAAFRLASAQDSAFAREATLVVKFMNASFAPERAAALLHAMSSLPRVVTIGAKLQQGMSSDLISHADCVVSLHRAEGLGLLVADAMARGIPVVATDYSGTAELLSAETGYPVKYRLVPVGEDEYPLSQGASWADPDVTDAAAQLLRVYRDQEGTKVVAHRAKQHLNREFGSNAAVAALRKALDEFTEAPV